KRENCSRFSPFRNSPRWGEVDRSLLRAGEGGPPVRLSLRRRETGCCAVPWCPNERVVPPHPDRSATRLDPTSPRRGEVKNPSRWIPSQARRPGPMVTPGLLRRPIGSPACEPVKKFDRTAMVAVSAPPQRRHPGEGGCEE